MFEMDDFNEPEHGDIVLTEHWRHEIITALIEAMKKVEFNKREEAYDQIMLAASYLEDDDWSWLCLECGKPLIECECD